MRRLVVIITGLAALVFVNYSIYSYEQLLSNGDVVLLELAPVDPRSLMQGDYMALRFRASGDARGAGAAKTSGGYIVLLLDENRIGTFVRLDDGTPLAKTEKRVRYRVRNRRILFATNAFFFQEGTGEIYSEARYGEFRVDSDGEIVLTGLLNEQLAALGGAPP